MKPKARTKGAKKRGRPRIMDVIREPNGRPSRSGIRHEPADIVALQARVRHLGISMERAKDQKAGTFIGFLNIIGPRDGISDDQYEAAQSFLDLRSAYLRAIKAPDGTLSSGSIGMPSDEVSDAYIDWCNRTRSRYAECRKAIQATQNENRHENLWAALDLCIIRGHRHDHMIGAVRLLCNAMVRFFRSQ